MTPVKPSADSADLAPSAPSHTLPGVSDAPLEIVVLEDGRVVFPDLPPELLPIVACLRDEEATPNADTVT